MSLYALRVKENDKAVYQVGETDFLLYIYYRNKQFLLGEWIMKVELSNMVVGAITILGLAWMLIRTFLMSPGA